MDLDGTMAHQLASAGTDVADPLPSRDGSEVASVGMTSSASADVDVLDLAAGSVRVLAPVDDDDYGEFLGADVPAVWSPSP